MDVIRDSKNAHNGQNKNPLLFKKRVKFFQLSVRITYEDPKP